MHSGCANILNTQVLKEIVVILFPPPPLKKLLKYDTKTKTDYLVYYSIPWKKYKYINIFLSFSNDS